MYFVLCARQLQTYKAKPRCESRSWWCKLGAQIHFLIGLNDGCCVLLHHRIAQATCDNANAETKDSWDSWGERFTFWQSFKCRAHSKTQVWCETHITCNVLEAWKFGERVARHKKNTTNTRYSNTRLNIHKRRRYKQKNSITWWFVSSHRSS